MSCPTAYTQTLRVHESLFNKPPKLFNEVCVFGSQLYDEEEEANEEI